MALARPAPGGHSGSVSNDELYSTREVVKRRPLSASWLNKKRTHGDGPVYLKVGRKVLYRLQDIDTWLNACQRTNTSERGSGG